LFFFCLIIIGSSCNLNNFY